MAGRIDDLISRLGDSGRFQLMLAFLLALNEFPIFFNNIVNTFYLVQVPHRCKMSVADDWAADNSSVGSARSSSISSGSSTGGAYMIEANHDNECLLYMVNVSTGQNYSMSNCEVGWTYEPVDNEWTISAEWDLVCDHSYLSSLVVTIYFLGVMVGGPLFGFLADKFGRKPVLLLCLYTPIILGASAAYIQHYEIFAVFRFLTGSCIQGLQTTTFVMTMELFLTKKRARAGTFIELMIGVVVMALAGLAYLLRNWRHLQLAISLPSLLAIPYIFVVPESLRWLLLRGRFNEAELVGKRFSFVNKLEFPKELFERIKEEMSADDPTRMTRQYGFMDIFSEPNIRKISLIMFLIWLTASLGYYGMSLEISNLMGNKYLNLFLGGFLEFVVYLILFFSIARLSRKHLVASFLLIGAICCVTGQLIPSSKSTEVLSSAFMIIGRCAYAGLLCTLFVYTAELFPTVVRNIGLGSCLCWSRIGSILSPQIVVINQYLHPTLPFIILGVLSFISAGLSLLLTETKDTKLPDNIDDLNQKYMHNIPVIIVNEPEDSPPQTTTMVNGTGTTNGTTTTAIIPSGSPALAISANGSTLPTTEL